MHFRTNLTRWLLLAGMLLLARPPASSASLLDNPPPLSGWTHPSALPGGDSPLRNGIALSGTAVVRGSPVIAEIDGSATDGQEAAIAGGDGRLYVYHANGSLLWSVNVMPWACSTGAYDFKINSAPAVGPLFGDGMAYVVVSYGTMAASDCDGGVAAYRGSDGALAWRFSTRAWQQSQGYAPESLYGVVSSPSLADTDGNGRLQVGFGAEDRNIYLLNHDGAVRWYYNAADTTWSTPAFADANGDGRLDMIIGTAMSANGALNPPTQDGGFLYAFDTAPRTPRRIEFCSGGCAGSAYIWQAFFDQAILSSPVIATVRPDLPGPQIIIGNGCAFAQRGRWVKILRLSDGATLQTLGLPPGSACVQSSVAVGDLDDDGVPEVVAEISGATAMGGDGYGRVAAWRPRASSTPWWSLIPRNASAAANDPYLGDLAAPAIADLDGNGSLEVLVSNMWDVTVIDGRTGAQLTCGGPSCGATTSLFAWWTLKSTPAVGDLNGDGTLDVLIGGAHMNDSGGTRGYFYAWTNLGGLLASSPGQQAAYSAPWPMFGGNAQHTGSAAPHRLVAAPGAIQIMLPRGSSQRFSISLTSADGASLAWSASEDDPSRIMQVSPANGTTGGAIALTVSAPSAPGSYTGTLRVSTAGAPPISIPVALSVPERIYSFYLPLILH
ncbi:MAG: VCBS repeat-containing protein [Chloroflexi bacterium]|nr:VCBS repeat-containing protein [Chloroflexota bacterium]